MLFLNANSNLILEKFTHLAVVHQLITVVFAFVRTNQEHQFVFLQKCICHIRTEVRSGATQSIWLAAFVVLRIAPKNVKHLINMERFDNLWLRHTYIKSVKLLCMEENLHYTKLYANDIFHLFPLHFVDNIRSGSTAFGDWRPKQGDVLNKI